MDKLKPCPFCGENHTDLIEVNNSDIAPSNWVECYTCGAFGPTKKTYAEAVEVWNRRK
jgi:Lar family restriction alleviation protein